MNRNFLTLLISLTVFAFLCALERRYGYHVGMNTALVMIGRLTEQAWKR